MDASVPILFTIPNFITAGSGRAMLNIIERLDRARFEPAVCVMKKGGNLDREVEKLGIPFIEAPFAIPAKPYTTLLFRAWNAAQILRSYHFQLWHSFHYSDDYTEPVIAKWAGAQWIYTKKNMNWFHRSWYVRTFLAKRVVAQNQDMINHFFNGVFKKKARLISRGIDLNHFQPGVTKEPCLRKSLGIPEEAILAGCVAHLVPVKGHPTLLQAAAKISGIHVLIAGRPADQEYVNSLKKLAVDLRISGRIHFLGDQTDINSFHAQVDIFVLPTWAKWRQEGCPVALLEAMACGKACIATDIPGSRDIIENGTNGILIPSENVDALAQAMKEMANSFSLRQRLGEAARKRIEDYFTIDKEVMAHEKLYSELLNL